MRPDARDHDHGDRVGPLRAQRDESPRAVGPGEHRGAAPVHVHSRPVGPGAVLRRVVERRAAAQEVVLGHVDAVDRLAQPVRPVEAKDVARRHPPALPYLPPVDAEADTDAGSDQRENPGHSARRGRLALSPRGRRVAHPSLHPRAPLAPVTGRAQVQLVLLLLILGPVLLFLRPLFAPEVPRARDRRACGVSPRSAPWGHASNLSPPRS